MSKKDAKNRSLTVLLLREGGKTADYYVRDDAYAEKVPLPVVPGSTWNLYIGQGKAKIPKWADFFASHVETKKFGQSKTAAAVLLVPIKDRWFAVTFGQGRYLLHAWALEEGFGLRVALNSISSDGIRSIDKDRFDSVAGQARLQATKNVPIRDFDLDANRDLFKAITGTPDDESIAQRLTGRDSLGISRRIELAELGDLLGKAMEQYESNAYKKRFPWIDQVRAIKSSDEIDRLNSQLLDALNERDFSQTWLAPPEVLDWSEVRFFTFSQARKSGEYIDIHWERCLADKDQKDAITLEWIRNQRVYCFGDDDEIIASWPLYGCIYAELKIGKEVYVLSTGKWYRIATDFREEIADFYAKVPVVEDLLPAYSEDDRDEAAYNKRVSSESGGKFMLLDRDLIYYGGKKDKVEFCDLLSSDCNIIHVKRYSGSRELSHLFAQALVSGEAVHLGADFRGLVNKKLPSSHHLPEDASKFDPRQYRITLGIISQSSKKLDLPFFSKVTLRQVVERLQGYGYQVQLAKISVTEVAAKTARFTRLAKKKNA